MIRIAYFLPAVMALAVSTASFAPLNDADTNTLNTLCNTRIVASKWVLNKSNSSVSFSLTHLVVSTAEGVFKTFDGTMESTKADFSDAKISFSVDVASVDTDSEGRDHHLKGEDYFNVAKYPKMSFESTSFKPAGGKKYKLAGNLTIRDVKKAVEFDVVYEGGTTSTGAKATFKCTTVINRYDYNVKAGGAALGKDVTINVNVEMDEVK